MPDSKPIAEMTLNAAYPDGSSRSIHMWVGTPTPLDEHFTCPVGLDGLHENLRPIYGVGSWHALMSGLRFIRELLKTEVDRGARLSWPDDEDTSVEELFSLHEIK